MASTSFEKETPTQYTIHPLLRSRWSSRSFSSRPVDPATINSLLEAMRWAPSSMNEQPWEVIAAEKGTATYQLLSESLMPGNKTWAADAPLLMLAIARTAFANGATNHSAVYDLGLAVGNLSVEATHRDLALHQMGGFDRNAVAAGLSLGDDRRPVVVIAVGYRDHYEKLPEQLQQRELAPRKRKPVADFARIELAQPSHAQAG